MKIKIIAGFKPGPHYERLNPGDVLEARVLPGGLVPSRQPYQCIEGPYSGILIERTHAIELNEEEEESAKVSLPQEVAGAIQSFRDEGKDVDYIVRAMVAKSWGTPTKRLQILLDYAANNGFKLISALVNGYTVERDMSSLEKEITVMIDEWVTGPVIGSAEQDRARLASQILERIKQENVRKSG